MQSKSLTIIPDERIIGKIYLIRGEKVMLDRDLAALYEVETKALNRAVKRNINRFPPDFMFQLSKEEAGEFLRFHFGTFKKEENLRYQIGTSSHGGRRYQPYAFTEQGVAMLSAVLKSGRAVEVSVQIVRVFIKMRKLLAGHKELREKIEKMQERANGRLTKRLILDFYITSAVLT